MTGRSTVTHATKTIGNLRIDLIETSIDFRIWTTDLTRDIYLGSPIVRRTLDDAKDAFIALTEKAL